jgi:acyl dehydratase
VRYLGDFPVGTEFELGSTVVTEESIIRFGREFDPQPFHIDPRAAEETSFGGLIASGWHVCSIFMRHFVDSLLSEAANLGGLGVDDMHWKVPVRPGDVLRAKAKVLETRLSSSKPDRGILGMLMELVNQRGEVVWYGTSWSLTSIEPETGQVADP